MMDLLNDIGGFLTTEEIAEEERELQRQFEEDNFVPADGCPLDLEDLKALHTFLRYEHIEEDIADPIDGF